MWLENDDLVEGVLAKDVFAQGATKYVYQVSGNIFLRQILSCVCIAFRWI